MIKSLIIPTVLNSIKLGEQCKGMQMLIKNLSPVFSCNVDILKKQCRPRTGNANTGPFGTN